jgi:hypothetical protein
MNSRRLTRSPPHNLRSSALAVRRKNDAKQHPLVDPFLLGERRHEQRRIEVGGSMIAIDTLVHNFLHRTGILRRFDAKHAYGLACYRPGGCADIIQVVAEYIDARQFNASYSKIFPRFVQHAIWRYCSQSGRDVCNGNRIDDTRRCENKECRVRLMCDRVALR